MIRDKVFISYSHRDKDWMERLQTMLKPLVRAGKISLWDDTTIQPGANWQEEIEDALARARVAVLLVSAEFLASDFITEKELPALLWAAEEEGVRILWVYVRPCLYTATPIGDYQAAHDPKKALADLRRPEQDRVLLEISQRIQEAVAESPPVPVGSSGRSVALDRLSERHEVLPLPERGDGIARVLSIHLGPTTVIGRCYAAQLQEAARRSLEALGEDRVHWVLAWDDGSLNQLIARLRCRTTQDRCSIEVQNITGYSARKQSLAVTAEAGSERMIQAGENVEFSLHPDVALTLTSGRGSGRKQLVRLVARTISCGGTRFPVLHTAATTFLFPPSGGEEATLIRYLGGWIPLGYQDLASLRPGGAQPVRLRFLEDHVELRIDSLAGRLRVKSRSLDLKKLLDVDEDSMAAAAPEET